MDFQINEPQRKSYFNNENIKYILLKLQKLVILRIVLLRN